MPKRQGAQVLHLAWQGEARPPCPGQLRHWLNYHRGMNNELVC